MVTQDYHDENIRLLVMGSFVYIVIAGCSSFPDVLLGFQPDEYYPLSFQVQPSETGRQKVQAYIAEALTLVLKGNSWCSTLISKFWQPYLVLPLQLLFRSRVTQPRGGTRINRDLSIY